MVLKIIGQKVEHKRFGIGTVTNFIDSYMEVIFSKGEVKKFRYPDAFEEYLRVDNAELTKKIEADLEKRRLEKEYTDTKRTVEVYEHLEDFARKKKLDHERKKQEQIEKQRQAQLRREQLMQNRTRGNA